MNTNRKYKVPDVIAEAAKKGLKMHVNAADPVLKRALAEAEARKDKRDA